jgi:hypothetical protein
MASNGSPVHDKKPTWRMGSRIAIPFQLCRSRPVTDRSAESQLRSETNTFVRTLGAPALTRAGRDLSTRLPRVACPLSRFVHHAKAIKAVVPDTPSYARARLVHPSM